MKENTKKGSYMRKLTAGFISTLCLAAALATPAVAANQTVTGKIVDIDYYARTKNGRGKGLDENLIAARASVRWEGMPAGIVTADGKAYQITGGVTANSNVKIAEYLGKTVTVTGEVSEKDGMTMISVDEVKGSK